MNWTIPNLQMVPDIDRCLGTLDPEDALYQPVHSTSPMPNSNRKIGCE